MPVDDFLADREANTGAGILCAGVQPLEKQKNALLILWVHADPIIADRESPLASQTDGGDMYFGSLLLAVFDRIPYEI